MHTYIVYIFCSEYIYRFVYMCVYIVDNTLPLLSIPTSRSLHLAVCGIP